MQLGLAILKEGEADRDAVVQEFCLSFGKKKWSLLIGIGMLNLQDKFEENADIAVLRNEKICISSMLTLLGIIAGKSAVWQKIRFAASTTNVAPVHGNIVG